MHMNRWNQCVLFASCLMIMDVHIACRFLFILNLVSHGISVPISNYYDNTQTQDYHISDDLTDSYERFPRNVVPSPYLWQQDRWFARSLIPSRPRQASKRHYHLFHLTSKHPNAVSYHVIQKPHKTRENRRRHKVESHPRRSYLYNNDQYQSNPVQSYYQQPNYQYSGYPAGYGSSFPQPSQNQYGVPNGVHDSTYDDILQEVSKPLQLHKTRSAYGYGNHHDDVQNDQTSSGMQEAAKQFKLASADMTNMELASLVMYPLPRYLSGEKVHEQKKNDEKHHKTNHKIAKNQPTKLKIESQEKEEDNLVDKLIKNDNEEKIEDKQENDREENEDKENNKLEKEEKKIENEDKQENDREENEDKENNKLEKEEKKIENEDKQENDKKKTNEQKEDEKQGKGKESDNMDDKDKQDDIITKEDKKLREEKKKKGNKKENEKQTDDDNMDEDDKEDDQVRNEEKKIKQGDKHGNDDDKRRKQKDMEDENMVKENKENDEKTKEVKKIEKKKRKENDKGNKENVNDDKKVTKIKEDDEMNEDGKESTFKDSWDEEDISSKEDEKFTSSKRSEIPHVIDEVANSDDERQEKDKKKDDKKNADSVVHSNESENKPEKEGKKDDSHKVEAVEEDTDEESDGPMKIDDEQEQSGMQESEFGHGHLNESDVTDDDDDSSSKLESLSGDKKKSDHR